MPGFLSEAQLRSGRKRIVPGRALCGKCGLYKHCQSPKMPVSGEGHRKILIVGEAPSREEDEHGKAFAGNSGKELARWFRKSGVSLEKDCWRSNAIICRPENNRTPTNPEIEYCRPNILHAIKDLRPRVIVPLGLSAVKSVISHLYKQEISAMTTWAGWVIPSVDWNCWIIPTYHPSFLLREDNPVLEMMFSEHLSHARERSKSRPYEIPPAYEKRVETISRASQVAKIIRAQRKAPAAAFDFETNMLKPEGPGAEIITCAISWASGPTIAYPMVGEAIPATKSFLKSKTAKIAANMKFEDRWSRKILKTQVRNWFWDTMLEAHIADNRQGITSLDFQAFVRLGVSDYSSHMKQYLRGKGGMGKNKIDQADMRDLLLYNGLDAVLELELCKLQRKEQQHSKPYRLLHDGALALSQVESTGILIDGEYLDLAKTHTMNQNIRGEKKLQQTKIFRIWKRRYGAKTNLDSAQQLGEVLFKQMGYPCNEYTATGKPKTDETSLEATGHPFVRSFLSIKKQKKALSTYLKGNEREVDPDNLLHAVYNLHLVKTYRGSSDTPNFQNIPIRNAKIGKLIRRALWARPGRRLVEVDYAAIEVRVAACYHKDPAMLDYIQDPTKDLHKDMAAECFLCEPDQVSKMVRYVGKNMFVFPQFYGSIHTECAKNMWEACTQLNLEIEGMPARKWLKRRGIKELGDTDPKAIPGKGTLVRHMDEVCTRFWQERFPVYNRWKTNWYNQYLETGQFEMLTGFVCQGYYKRNEVINYAVQGAAFHCLLWSLIELQKRLRKEQMKSQIVGQIHDSMLGDVLDDELPDYLSHAQEIMCVLLPAVWRWIITPLEIEAEATPIGGSWFEKKEIPLP